METEAPCSTWRRTSGVAPDAMKVARPVLNGGDEETGLCRPRLVATQLESGIFCVPGHCCGASAMHGQVRLILPPLSAYAYCGVAMVSYVISTRCLTASGSVTPCNAAAWVLHASCPFCWG